MGHRGWWVEGAGCCVPGSAAPPAVEWQPGALWRREMIYRPPSVGPRQYSLMEPGSEASTSGLVSSPAFHVLPPPPLDGSCGTVPSPLPNCSHPPCNSPPPPSPHCSLNYHSTPLPSGSPPTLQTHTHTYTVRQYMIDSVSLCVCVASILPVW